ncbi:hypothetical protein NDU88_007293 [Pleurodeles waltl]|uniref:Uncharacterized protein n=1 Tax=Pleurodeles waltl TaxID=8319 RepID=A0AAV7UNE4_PLEWA|nr:hypothetical protein NDU88_007293 [Pleurodeles waltl]
MVAQRHGKKEGTLKELFVKSPVKKQEHSQGAETDVRGSRSGEQVEEDTTPMTKSFLEHLFVGLQEDLASLRQKITTTAKELKREVAELEQRVDTVECTHDAQAEVLDHHRQEILTLQDTNREPQYRLEDLENRSRHSNIRIRGLPSQATPGSLEDFVICLFCQVAPALKDQEIILDGTHKTDRPSQTPDEEQDILMCLHY